MLVMCSVRLLTRGDACHEHHPLAGLRVPHELGAEVRAVTYLLDQLVGAADMLGLHPQDLGVAGKRVRAVHRPVITHRRSVNIEGAIIRKGRLLVSLRYTT